MAETVEDRVKKLIVENLGVDAAKVTPTALIVDDLGADSLDCAQLVVAFDEEFLFEVSAEDAKSVRSVGDACALMRKYIGEPKT